MWLVYLPRAPMVRKAGELPWGSCVFAQAERLNMVVLHGCDFLIRDPWVDII